MVAQKRHFAVFAYKTDFLIDKSLQYSLCYKLSAVVLCKKILGLNNRAETLVANVTFNQTFCLKNCRLRRYFDCTAIS